MAVSPERTRQPASPRQPIFFFFVSSLAHRYIFAVFIFLQAFLGRFRRREATRIAVILVSFGPVAPGTIYPPEINGFVSPE
jgi:hypothetical protein